MSRDPGCVFCSIIAGQAHARIVHQDDNLTAFWDHHPATPVHILIVPNKHIQSINELEEEHANLIGKMTLLAQKIARDQGVDQSGYRLVINSGADAGQTIFHLHLHLIGGQQMRFRPQ